MFPPRLLVRLVGLLSMMAGAAHAQSDGAAARTIRALRERSNAAIAAHDTAGIGAILAPNVIIMTSASAIQQGREASLRGFAEQFRTRDSVSYRRTPDRVDVFDDWGMASESGRWVGGWRDADGAVSLGGSYFAKWRWRDGRWLVESETYVPDRCVGGSYCRSLLPAGASDRLPSPVSNNAVAVGLVRGEPWVVSMLGIDSTRAATGITATASLWTASSNAWRPLPPVPGGVGRLAATAQIVRGRVYLFGGYTVDPLSARERSLPQLDIYDPETSQWRGGAPIPVPVDDAISGVYRDSLIYLVSGWSDTNSVATVQFYDVVGDRWSMATRFPGTPVFGHAGTVAGNTIVLVDGAAKSRGAVRYAPVRQSWIGVIDPADPTRIAWRRGPARAGPALYRAASATCGTHVVIAGGTDNPYNFNGIGYDTRIASPSAAWWAFDTVRSAWTRLPDGAVGTMDHRNLARVGGELWVVGGMRAGPRVSDQVERIPVANCTR
jgi:ketosteroid isomerase-like protein